MSENPEVRPPRMGLIWLGRIMSLLPVLMLLMSGSMKIAKPPMVIEGFEKLGFPESIALGLGITELTCTILYVIPRTSILGAILLTGYLGGAISAHVRLGEPFIPVIVLSLLIWGGLYFREHRLRSLIPFRTGC